MSRLEFKVAVQSVSRKLHIHRFVNSGDRKVGAESLFELTFGNTPSQVISDLRP